MATRAIDIAAERLTFEEFLTAYDGTNAEWVDGTVLPTSPVSDRHQDIAEFLGALMRDLAQQSGAGVVRTSLVTMKLGPIARVPDLLFLAAEHRDRRKPTFIDGPADLVVEIVSPESRGRDRGEKFYEYEQAGVREYWLVDPLRETVDVFRLDDRGRYAAGAPGGFRAPGERGAARLLDRPRLAVGRADADAALRAREVGAPVSARLSTSFAPWPYSRVVARGLDGRVSSVQIDAGIPPAGLDEGGQA